MDVVEDKYSKNEEEGEVGDGKGPPAQLRI
jgi:hypothetical protein